MYTYLHPLAWSTHVTYGHDIPDLKSDHCRTNSVVIHVGVEKSFIALCVSEREPVVMDDAERIHRSRGRENPGVFIIHRRLLARCPNPPPRRKIAVQKQAGYDAIAMHYSRPPCMTAIRHPPRSHSHHLYSCSNPAQKRDELVGHNQWRNHLVTARKQFDSPECYRPEARLCETDLSHWTLSLPAATQG